MGHSFEIHERAGFRYVDEGPTSDVPPVVLLHGMLGDHSNWAETIKFLSEKQYRVIVPLIPVYNLPLRESSVSGLAAYVHRFVAAIGIRKMVLAGNSLGGHIALLYTIQHPDTVSALVLCGASGIYEVEMGTSMLRRKDRDELRRRAAFTFYDPAQFGPAIQAAQFLSPAWHGVELARSASGTGGAGFDAMSLVHLAVLVVLGLAATWSAITLMRRRLIR